MQKARGFISLILSIMLLMTMMPSLAYAEVGGEESTSDTKSEDEIEINEENFPDKCFREEYITPLDKDGNGSLSEEERTVLGYTEMKFAGIDTKGVEKLVFKRKPPQPGYPEQRLRYTIEAPGGTKFPFEVFKNAVAGKEVELTIKSTDDKLPSLEGIEKTEGKIIDLYLVYNDRIKEINLSEIRNTAIQSVNIMDDKGTITDEQQEATQNEKFPEIKAGNGVQKTYKLAIDARQKEITDLDLSGSLFSSIDIIGDLRNIKLKGCTNLYKLNISAPVKRVSENYGSWDGYSIKTAKGMETLDLRGLNKLKILKANECNIKNLHLDKGQQLDTVWLGGNHLTHIYRENIIELKNLDPLVDNFAYYLGPQSITLTVEKANDKYVYNMKKVVGEDNLKYIHVAGEGYYFNKKTGNIEIDDVNTVKSNPVTYCYRVKRDWRPDVVMYVTILPESIEEESAVKDIKLKTPPAPKVLKNGMVIGLDFDALVVTLIKEDGSEEDVRLKDFYRYGIELKKGNDDKYRYYITHLKSKKTIKLYEIKPNTTVKITVANGEGSGVYNVDDTIEIGANVPEGREFGEWICRHDYKKNIIFEDAKSPNTKIRFKDIEGSLNQHSFTIEYTTKKKSLDNIKYPVEINKENFPDPTFRDVLAKKFKAGVITKEDSNQLWYGEIKFSTDNFKGIECFDFYGVNKGSGGYPVKLHPNGKFPFEILNEVFMYQPDSRRVKVLVEPDEYVTPHVMNLDGIEKVDNLKYIEIAYEDNTTGITFNPNFDFGNVKEVKVYRYLERHKFNREPLPEMKAPDMSFLKSFPNLKKLSVNGNMCIDGNLDLRENAKLEELTLAGYAKSLDISACNKLKRLGISGSGYHVLTLAGTIIAGTQVSKPCQLESIDLSNHPQLEYLRIDYTEMSSLDISGQDKLTSLSLASNKIENIVLGEHPYLEEVKLRGTPVKELNLSGLKKLKTFKFSGYTKLEETGWGPQVITLPDLIGPEHIDFSHNKELRSIHITDSNIKDINVDHNPKLRELIAYHNRLPYVNLSGIKRSLSFNVNGDSYKSKIQQPKIKAKRVNGKLVIDIGSVIGKENLKNIYELQTGWNLDKETGYIEIPEPWGMTILRGSNASDKRPAYRGFFRYLYKAPYPAHLSCPQNGNHMLVNVYLDNQKPVVKVEKETVRIKQGEKFDPILINAISATDVEDGYVRIREKDVIENTVKSNIPGEYHVTYRVKDSWDEAAEPVTVKVIVEPIKVNDVVVKSLPTKTDYEEWDRLDLKGLVVELVTGEGTQTLKGYDIIKKGISISPAEGSELAMETNKVVLTHDASGKGTSFDINVQTPSKPKYKLDVIGGVGGGRYKEGNKVEISAVVPMGHKFVRWKATAGNPKITDKSSPITHIEMPGRNAKVEAITEPITAVTVSQVKISTNPKMKYFTGDKLDLSEMVVTLIRSDGITERVPFALFEEKGIKTSQSHGDELNYDVDFDLYAVHVESEKVDSVKIRVFERVKPKPFEGKLKIDEINFPDEKFRSTLVRSLDKDKDGYLTAEEAYVTKDAPLKFSTDNFKGLDKIYFENIDRLYVDAPAGAKIPFHLFKDAMVDEPNKHGRVRVVRADDSKALPNISELSELRRISKLEILGTPNDKEIIVDGVQAEEILVKIRDDEDNNAKVMPKITVKNCRRTKECIISSEGKLKANDVNISDLPAVEIITAEGSAAEKISVDSCPQLKELWFSGCKAKPVNFTTKNVKSLKQIVIKKSMVDKLSIEDIPNLISLSLNDVTGIANFKIASSTLRALSLTHSDLEKLDIDGCEVLESLAVEDAPMHEFSVGKKPDINNVKIESTNISKIDKLTGDVPWHNLDNNRIPYVDFDEEEYKNVAGSAYNQYISGRLKVLNEGGRKKVVFDVKELVGDKRIKNVVKSVNEDKSYSLNKEKGYIEINDLEEVKENGVQYDYVYIHHEKQGRLRVHVSFAFAKPVIKAEDKKIFVGEAFDPFKDVVAEDETGIFDLDKNNTVFESDVNPQAAGVYHVKYKVTSLLGVESDEKTITVTVEEPTVTEMSVSKAPKTDYYEGEKISLAGLAVQIRKNNGAKETISYEAFAAAGITVTPENGEAANPSKDKLIITHEKTGVKAEVKLNIREKKVIKAEFNVPEGTIKATYKEGEKLELQGVTALLTKEDGSQETIGIDEFEKRGISITPANGSSLTPDVKAIVMKHKNGDSFKRNIKVIPKPKIIEGAGGKWKKGSESGLNFKSDGTYETFLDGGALVNVDGKKLSENDFTHKKGSIAVTLKPKYLEELDLGEHSIEILSAEGVAECKFSIISNKPEPSPAGGNNSGDNGSNSRSAKTGGKAAKTGDSNDLTGKIVSILAAMAMMAIVVRRRYRKL